MTVGERIRKFRGEKGMTQKELSEKAGVELSALQRYERGACVPTRKTLERLAQALGLNILHLMCAYGGPITVPPEEEDKVSHPEHYQRDGRAFRRGGRQGFLPVQRVQIPVPGR